jgi:putative Mg2+ transporter-C (MgtC) family protein
METLRAYWSYPELQTNGLLLLHLIGALAVGMMIGYERSFHGRAAGLRTYSLVCMASTMLTVIVGYPAMWYGGLAVTSATSDPTRVIQGVMTGIGFLGAGVIIHEGHSIRGLSTAASIWMTAAIGVLIGLGFYATAIFAGLLTMAVMSGARGLEYALPHQTMLHVTLAYARDRAPPAEEIRAMMQAHGFSVIEWSFHSAAEGNRFEYKLVMQAYSKPLSTKLVDSLASAASLLEFHLSPTRS